jgi:hypothetical protein
MNSSSNTTSFATLTQTYPMTVIGSGVGANTDILIATGGTNASVITDILFRNLDGTNARVYDIIICSTGLNGTNGFQRTQITIPANSGNNGTTPLASLAALAPLLFDLDLAGNRVITLENGTSIYVRNIATTTAQTIIMVKQRNF